MRRLLLLAFLSASAVGASIALAAPGREAGPIPAVHCSVQRIQIFFWPHGHPAIQGLGFPPYAPPHLEIYRARSVASSAFLAFMSANGYSAGSSCVKTTDTATQPLHRGLRFVTTTKRRRLTCFFHATVFGFQFVPTKDSNGNVVGEQLRVMGGGKADTLVTANISATGAKLKYAARACRPLAIPA
jgi:hypothetical protein